MPLTKKGNGQGTVQLGHVSEAISVTVLEGIDLVCPVFVVLGEEVLRSVQEFFFFQVEKDT